MAANGESDERTLADLRARIDAIDDAMHRLLIERGAVIDALIVAKGTRINGAAFRPQREAEMMRRLAARHSGHLPLATVEHLWREIIGTFTSLQAPFRVFIDLGDDNAAMHDRARFTFGHSVDLIEADGPEDVIARVTASGRDLGLIPADTTGGSWWRRLSADKGPRLMALLPFIIEKGRPATGSAFVISPLLSDPSQPDLMTVAARASEAAGKAVAQVPDIAILAIAPATASGTTELLLAMPATDDLAALRQLGLRDCIPVGGIARGIALGCDGDLLRARLDTKATLS